MAAIPVPHDHRNFGPAALGVAWGLFVPATMFIGARLYVRLGLRKNVGWDDFWILLAWAFSLYTCICTQLAVDMGGGQHLYYDIQNLPRFQRLLKYIVMVEFGVVWGISLLKISVVVFVLRLIRKSPNLRYICWICYVDLVLFVPMTFALFMVVCLQCRPLSAFWNELIPADKCIDKLILGNVITAYSSLSAASDLLTGVLPVFILMGLQMERSRRITACVLTGLGCCISAAAIYKAVIAIKTFTGDDLPIDIAPMYLECSIELNLGIIVACIPTLVPLFEKLGVMRYGRFAWLRAEKHASNPSKVISAPHGSDRSLVFRQSLAQSTSEPLTRQDSERKLIEERDEEKAVDADDRGPQSNAVIMQTIDVEICEHSDRESVWTDDGKVAHPWLQVGRGLRTI